MANTVTVDSSGVITVVPDGATDFDLADYFPNGIYLRSIAFVVSDNADVLYIRVKDAAGVQLISGGLSATNGISYVEIEPRKRKLYMKTADCTFTTPANCIITLYFD